MNVFIAALIVKERTGRPEAVGVAWEMLTQSADGIDGVRVDIADVPRLVRGPRAGQLDFKACGPRLTQIVTQADYDVWLAAWLAADPTNCEKCANSREQFVRWPDFEGAPMRPCDACSARDVDA